MGVSGLNPHPSAVCLPQLNVVHSLCVKMLVSVWAATAVSSPILCCVLPCRHCKQQELEAWVNLQVTTFLRRYLEQSCKVSHMMCGPLQVVLGKDSSQTSHTRLLACSLLMFSFPGSSLVATGVIHSGALQNFAYLCVHHIYSHI